MRYCELLELFDKKAEYTVTFQEKDEFIAEFTVDARRIRWTATLYTNYDKDHNELPSEWDVCFSEINPNTKLNNFQLTKGGNEFQIMATVKAIMSDFFTLYQPKIIGFSAAVKEESRVTLYTKMAMKFIPRNYTLLTTDKPTVREFRFKRDL